MELANHMIEDLGKEKVAESSLKSLNKVIGPDLIGPIYIGLKLSGMSDEDLSDAMNAFAGIIGVAQKGLKDSAYEYQIKDDEDD